MSPVADIERTRRVWSSNLAEKTRGSVGKTVANTPLSLGRAL